MTGPAASVSFDPRPLVEPVDRNAVREYARRLRESGAVRSMFGSSATVIATVIAVVFFLMFGSVFVIDHRVGDQLADGDDHGRHGHAVPVRGLRRGAADHRHGRCGGGRRDLLRARNVRPLRPLVPPRAVRGGERDDVRADVRGTGSARHDLRRRQRPRLERPRARQRSRASSSSRNYQYTTGSGKNRTTHRWGYVAIKLDVPLPHIVLDATSNNGLFGSNLPMAFDKDQKLSLEGDFDRYFSLYCPQGYEQDALYLFTPDIMARFIDNAAALDVEIVDDWLFLYGKREFSSLDPATWAWLFSVVAALLDKFAQWARWRDDQLRTDAAAGVAATRGAVGRRDSRAPRGRHPLCRSPRRPERCARRRGSPSRVAASSAASRG